MKSNLGLIFFSLIPSTTKPEQFVTQIEPFLRFYSGNTKGGSITVHLTSCLTGLD